VDASFDAIGFVAGFLLAAKIKEKTCAKGREIAMLPRRNTSALTISASFGKVELLPVDEVLPGATNHVAQVIL
jgi:hypothetical protein